MSEKLLISIKWLPYKTMFIPMMHFLKHLPSKDFSQRTQRQENYSSFGFGAHFLTIDTVGV
ncbi:MAG: hypothetical protein WA118_01420 [Carboxydocellales bacterium]